MCYCDFCGNKSLSKYILVKEPQGSCLHIAWRYTEVQLAALTSKTKDMWVLVQIIMQTGAGEQIAVYNLLSFDLLLLQVPDNPPNYILFLNNLPEETNEMMLSMLFNQ